MEDESRYINYFPYEISFSFKAKFQDFSDEDFHKPGDVAVCTKVRVNSSSKRPNSSYFLLYTYANGSNKENEGFVSVHFRGDKHIAREYDYLVLSFTAEVIDVFGEKIFPQSYCFARENYYLKDPKKAFGLNQFISRQKLLDDAVTYLPDDCLTLEICVNIKVSPRRFSDLWLLLNDSLSPYPDSSRIDDLSKYDSFEGPSNPEDDNTLLNEDFLHKSQSQISRRLWADSPEYRCLKEESKVLERMFETPMIEQKRGYVEFSIEIFNYLRVALFIVLKMEAIKLDSVGDLFYLYDCAQFYDMQTVIETCVEWLENILIFIHNLEGDFTHIYEVILYWAEKHDDLNLEELVLTYYNKDTKQKKEVSNISENEKVKSWNFDLRYKKLVFSRLNKRFENDDVEHLYF